MDSSVFNNDDTNVVVYSLFFLIVVPVKTIAVIAIGDTENEEEGEDKDGSVSFSTTVIVIKYIITADNSSINNNTE